jgi:hypothetical protein
MRTGADYRESLRDARKGYAAGLAVTLDRD